MNVLYLCVISRTWVKTINKLDHELGFKCNYIVCWKNELDDYKKSFSSDIYLQTVEDLWKGLGFPINSFRVKFDPTKIDPSLRCIALKMMDRLDPDGRSFNLDLRNEFLNFLVNSWIDVLTARNINLIISPSIPHRVFDYALYIACNFLNIRFVMHQMTGYGSHSLLIEDLFNMPSINYSDLDTFIDPSFEVKNNSLKTDYKNAVSVIEENLEMRNNTSKSLFYSIFKLFISGKIFNLLTYKPNTYWVMSGFSPQKTNYSLINYYLMRFKRLRFIKKIKKIYDSKVTIYEHSQLPEKFVFFALHYQPEETTCPSGWIFYDQLTVLRTLISGLPEDVEILIKEHRSQFYYSMESMSGRRLSYYDDIETISSRIKFVDSSMAPFYLVDRALAVVTITGTIGWESAIRGTPALVFGRAWYEKMPRVLRVFSAQDIIENWERIITLKNVNFEVQINKFTSYIQHASVKSIHYKEMEVFNDVTDDQSVVNLVNFYKRYFLHSD